MEKFRLHIILGLIFILAGLFVSSSSLVAFLRTIHTGISEDLLLGAKLFRVGLIIIGAFVVVFGRIMKSRTDIPEEKDDYKPNNVLVLVFLLTILFISLALRIYGLNKGLWLDEILTFENYVKSPLGKIVTTYDSQNQHFLYSILAHISIILFGESVWALRLPAVLFGVGSVWALYFLGRQIANTREALLSAALLAFSYHHIWFSQNARGYIGLLFFTLVSSWLFVCGLKEDRPKFWLVYAVIAALGAFTHISMVFIVIGHFSIYLFSLIARRNEVWQTRWIPVMGFCLAALLTFQLYSLVLPQMFGGAIGHGRGVSVWRNPIWTIFEVIRGAKIGFKGVVPVIFATGILGLGVWNYVHKEPVVIGLFIIPILIVAAVTIVMGHHIWPRLFFFSIGFGILIVTRGSMEFGRLITRLLKIDDKKTMMLGNTAFALIILAFVISAPKAYGPKQDYLSALRFVEANKNLHDNVLTIGGTAFVFDKHYGLDWTTVEDFESFNSIHTNGKDTWIVYTFPAYLEKRYPEIMDVVRNDFELVRKFDGTLNGGTIFVCRSEVSSS
jgi:mannosyltransferase